MYYDVAVLGCGWAGINASYILSKSGHSVVCIEKDARPGGLLKTEVISGFTIDTGGSHIIFSRDKAILDRLLNDFLKGNYISHNRYTYVSLNKTLVPYPFENGLYVLSPEERANALINFIEALLSLDENWVPKNLKEWIYGFFGKWIADKYLVPYNEKLWKRPLEEIDVDWVYTPGRLPFPDWREIVKSAVGLQTMGYSEQAKFYYPLRGGIQALFSSVYEETIKNGGVVVTSTRIENIKQINGELIIKVKDKQIKTKRIINTVPLPELISILKEQYIELDTRDFDYNKVLVVAVALNKQAPNQHWIYTPGEDTVFHRYIWMSNYSPYNAPTGKSLLITETTIPGHTKVTSEDIEKYISRTLEDLEKIDVIKLGEVLFVKTWLQEYGYPIHRVSLTKTREKVIMELKKYNIVTIGRWGKWKYLNMDMVLKDVMLELNQIHGKKP